MQNITVEIVSCSSSSSSSSLSEKNGSSSSLPTGIGSSPSLLSGIVSSPSIPTEIGSYPSDIGSYPSEIGSYPSESSSSSSLVGQTIIDPVTEDKYILMKEIGSSSNGLCRVYRALYYKRLEENDILVYSDLVILKIIYLHESNELEEEVHTSISYTPHGNLIGLKRTFRTEELLCISLPYMSEGSLRYILSARPNKKLPEDFIRVVLKEALIALRDDLHVEFNPRAHKTLNAGDIFVHIDDATGEILIKLAFEASVYDYENINTEENPSAEASSSTSFLDMKSISKWGAAPEVFHSDGDTSGVKSDIWLLGIMALELAYGDLPVRNREDLDCIIKNIREMKRFPRSLEKLLLIKKGKGKLKKVKDLIKRKRKVFSEEFEKIVLSCLCENPENRPTADELLNTPFFTTGIERFKQFVLIGKNPDPIDIEEFLEDQTKN